MKLINSIFLFCTLFLTKSLLVSSKLCSGLPFANIHFKKPENWGKSVYAYIYSTNSNASMSFPEWPGYLMHGENEYYHLTHKLDDFSDYRVVFNDGKKFQTPEIMKEGYDYVNEAVYSENGIIGINEVKNLNNYYNADTMDIKYKNIAKVIYKPKANDIFNYRDDIYIHYKIGNGKWNSLPGGKMNYYPCGNIYYINIDLKNAKDITFCFTDDKGNWDNNYGEDYKFKKYSNIYIDHNKYF